MNNTRYNCYSGILHLRPLTSLEVQATTTHASSKWHYLIFCWEGLNVRVSLGGEGDQGGGLLHGAHEELRPVEARQEVGQGMEWGWGMCIIIYTMRALIFMRLYFCKLYE